MVTAFNLYDRESQRVLEKISPCNTGVLEMNVFSMEIFQIFKYLGLMLKKEKPFVQSNLHLWIVWISEGSKQ